MEESNHAEFHISDQEKKIYEQVFLEYDVERNGMLPLLQALNALDRLNLHAARERVEYLINPAATPSRASRLSVEIDLQTFIHIASTLRQEIITKEEAKRREIEQQQQQLFQQQMQQQQQQLQQQQQQNAAGHQTHQNQLPSSAGHPSSSTAKLQQLTQQNSQASILKASLLRKATSIFDKVKEVVDAPGNYFEKRNGTDLKSFTNSCDISKPGKQISDVGVTDTDIEEYEMWDYDEDAPYDDDLETMDLAKTATSVREPATIKLISPIPTADVGYFPGSNFNPDFEATPILTPISRSNRASVAPSDRLLLTEIGVNPTVGNNSGRRASKALAMEIKTEISPENAPSTRGVGTNKVQIQKNDVVIQEESLAMPNANFDTAPSAPRKKHKLTKRQEQALKDPKVREQLMKQRPRKPFVMIVMAITLIIMMIVELIINQGIENFNLNPMGGPSTLTLLHLGAKYVPCMKPDPTISLSTLVNCYPGYVGPTTNGQCFYYDNLQFICGGDTFNPHNAPMQGWRLLTPLFLHVGLIHLFFNMLMLVRTGIPLERLIGSIRMAILYVISGFGGFLFSSILATTNVTVGASAALYGFYGILLVDLCQNWALLAKPWRDLAFLIINIILSLAIGLLPFIDNYAHIGGFIIGIIASFIFLPKIYYNAADKKRKTIYMIICIPLLAGIFIAGIVIFYANATSTDVCPWCRYLDCVPLQSAWCANENPS